MTASPNVKQICSCGIGPPVILATHPIHPKNKRIAVAMNSDAYNRALSTVVSLSATVMKLLAAKEKKMLEGNVNQLCRNYKLFYL